MEFFNRLRQQIQEFFKRLTVQQRAVIVITAVAVVAVIIGLVFFGGASYMVLYSNLSQQDANQIVKKLQEKSIPYQLDNEGSTILIPADDVYELRLSLAGDGLPGSSIVGYEIFDKTNLGISDQTQKINRVRALEGELTKTILQIENVEAARVHIVLPEKRFFREDQKPATASVWLKTKGGLVLSSETSQGIAHLVASSVEGLDPSNVRIFDKRGILRSSARASNSAAGAISSNMDIQRQIEGTLSQKVQGMLDVVLGPGNSYVEISTEIDFRQVSKVEEKFDPENQVVRSEQIMEQQGRTNDTSRINSKYITSTNSNSTINYEIGKSIENSTSGGGDIKRISVSVVVNGRYSDSVIAKAGMFGSDFDTVAIYHSMTEKEISDITELVKKQVGFSSDRNDQIAVVNMQFFSDRELFGKEQQPDLLMWSVEQLKNPSTILMLFLMLGATFFLFSIARRIRFKKELEAAVALQRAARVKVVKGKIVPDNAVTMPATLEEGATALEVMQAEELGEEEMKAQQVTRDKVKTYFKDKPEEASSLLKVWLSENK
ncbi:MAG: flagellar M-ring protein FliF [Ignavibacteria bacterium]|nr:flagellar M-ring protein FliF [Ignavibacteria bacterium]